MARAIVVGISRLDDDRATYKKMQDARLALQKNAALELIRKAGIPVRAYRCDKCDQRRQHRCEHRCPACPRHKCPREEQNKIRCPECDLQFNGVDCFNYHKSEAQVRGEVREALCSYKYRCMECLKTVNTRIRSPNNMHCCNVSFCHICCSYQLKGHKCYMEGLSFTTADRQRHQQARSLFFDFETYVDEETGRLIPNMAVVQDDQGGEEVSPAEDEPFGRDISEDLCRFVLQEKHKGFHVIAYNFRLVNNGIMPKLMNGNKIIQLDVEQFHIHFRDSLNYNRQ
ncbi:hypothetical protein RvY_12337 [Ramazzottius varieornatus]|uniref:Uncharacterized protein n=1 Tax=Ramazzottius varieornatus TaxID=947166 RepID=A0A1D1VSX1_RAMVA|nr:hypothetical protein RvY_12337 [Ramazzottius varieornatus]